MAIASLSGNTLSTGDGLIIRGGASGSDVAIIGTCKSENFGFITNDTLRATFDSSGNLGIGTNEPSAVLDVRGAISTNTSIASPIVSGTTCIASPVICMTGTFSLPSSDGSSGQVMCTDGSGGLTWGQGGHVIALGGTAQTQRKCLNFAGLAVCASDNSSGNATNICVKSTGVCLPVIQDDGTQIYTCFTSAVIGDCLQGDATPKLGGNLDVNGNCLKSASDGNIVLCPDGSGVVKISSNCFPGSDGSSGQLICTNGSGALQWVTVTGATPGGNNNEIQYNNSGSFGASSNLSYDGSTLAVTGAQTLSGNLTVGTKNLHVNTSTNKVGIGTTSPGDYDTDDLVIQAQSGSQGGITIASDTNQAGRIYFADGTSGGSDARGMISYDHNNDKLSVGTAGSNRIYVHSDGHIALGGDTASVPGKVAVEGGSTTINDGRVLLTVFDDSNMASGVGGGVGFFGRHTNSSFTSFASVNAAKSNATDDNTDGDLVISTRQNSSDTLTEKMRIDSAGSVSIDGHANGLPSLELGKAGVSNALISAAESMYFSIDSNNDQTDRAYYFGHNANTTSVTTLMKIQEDGKVGIGLTNPAQVLDVNGSAHVANILYANESANSFMTVGVTLNQGGNDNEILSFKSSDVAHGITGFTETDTWGLFKKNNATDGGMRIESESGGGIAMHLFTVGSEGNTTKSTSAWGTIYLTSTKKSGTSNAILGSDENMVVMSNGNQTRFIFDADGDGHADSAWTTFSDSRLKKNVIDCPYGLAEVLQLQPKKFDRHSGKIEDGEVVLEDNARSMIGFLAQDVKALMPELVKDVDTTESFYSMDDGKFAAVLVNAIQELNAKIENLME